MKRNTLFALAASGMLLFAACEKKEGTFYRIDGDKITFTIAMDGPQSADKQTYHGPQQRVFFNAGDSIWVNGGVYPLLPMAHSTAPGSNTAYSPFAEVTAELSDDRYYTFVYPANKHWIHPDLNTWVGNYPSKVLLFNDADLTNLDTMGYGDFSAPFMPMFGYTYMHNLGDRFLLTNSFSMITPRINYGQQWFDSVFKPILANGGCDATDMAIDQGFLRLWGSNITGTASFRIDMDEFLTEIIPDSNARQLVQFKCAGNTICQKNIGTNLTNPPENRIGTLTLPPKKNSYMKIFRTCLKMKTVVNGTNYYILHYAQSPTFYAPIERNHHYTIDLNMNTVYRSEIEDIDPQTWGCNLYASTINEGDTLEHLCASVIVTTQEQICNLYLINVLAANLPDNSGSSKTATGSTPTFDGIKIK